jgi:hypothetical protein
MCRANIAVECCSCRAAKHRKRHSMMINVTSIHTHTHARCWNEKKTSRRKMSLTDVDMYRLVRSSLLNYVDERQCRSIVSDDEHRSMFVVIHSRLEFQPGQSTHRIDENCFSVLFIFVKNETSEESFSIRTQSHVVCRVQQRRY